MGGATNIASKRIASLLSAKRDRPYSLVMSCSILLQSTIACLRGARSIRGSPVVIGALDLMTSEGPVLPSC